MGLCIVMCYVIVTLGVGTEILMIDSHYSWVCQGGCCACIKKIWVPREDTFHSLAHEFDGEREQENPRNDDEQPKC